MEGTEENKISNRIFVLFLCDFCKSARPNNSNYGSREKNTNSQRGLADVLLHTLMPCIALRIFNGRNVQRGVQMPFFHVDHSRDFHTNNCIIQEKNYTRGAL